MVRSIVQLVGGGSLLTSSSNAAGLSDSSEPSNFNGVRHFWQYMALKSDHSRGGCGGGEVEVWGMELRERHAVLFFS